jgi:hypothetical protein
MDASFIAANDNSPTVQFRRRRRHVTATATVTSDSTTDQNVSSPATPNKVTVQNVSPLATPDNVTDLLVEVADDFVVCKITTRPS